MEYLTQLGPSAAISSFTFRRRSRYQVFSSTGLFISTLVLFLIFVPNARCVQIDQGPGESKPVNQVSIEDFIDLDDWSPSNTVVNNANGHEDQVVLSMGSVDEVTSDKPEILADDEDLLASGSGSGSGGFDLSSLDSEISYSGRMTPTTRFKLPPSKEEPDPVLVTIKEGGEPSQVTNNDGVGDNNVISLRSIEPRSERLRPGHGDLDASADLFDEDSAFDLPETSSFNSNNIINPASWLSWSQWQVVGSSAKVRVRTCQLGGLEVSDNSCEGVRVQMRACTDASKDECGRVEDVTPGLGDMCPQPAGDDIVVKEASSKAARTPPSPQLGPQSPPTPEPSCEYSLYDKYRYRFVFSRWNLTQVMSQSKLKKWCDRTSEQYIVMTTPSRTCRRLYKDLCQAAQKCRSTKPTRERGDFAEGCWRGLVYGDMLPVGLSNKQTIVYFICQRFAEDSAMGRTFGYKETHFGTLYDTQLRAPVVSLHKMAMVGDETWPDSDYFIEHGLVEEQKDLLWLFRRPRKGMLTLKDLDRCYDDQSCEVGLRQVLPADFDLSDQARYTPTHLVWPEWMPPLPAARVSTFTLTNTAPMLTSLYDEWHAKIRTVRRYAMQECGVPFDPLPNLSHVGQLSARRSNKAALYIASGVIPTQNPSKAIGRDVNVPFLFWVAGCCVQQLAQTDGTTTRPNSYLYSFGNLDDETKMVTNITAFSLYIENTEGSHVIAAPVLQLELLLQDMYKVKPSDPDVTLFPGQGDACSGLPSDVSKWFL